MNVRVNGIEHELPAGATLANLLERLNLAGAMVAVERNRELVPRARHAETKVVAGDAYEIVTLVGGG